MNQHPLIATLARLSGNPRGCVYTEPLWGIPFNLYAPYASLFMAALGVTDTQIGLVISVSWSFQIVTALLSGVLTDRFGRHRTTLVFDLLAWTVPAIISALAMDVWSFLAAGILNSLWRVPANSWTCLLVEDAEPEQLVDIYTWIYIANQIVGFVAPLTGFLIAAFALVPTVRGLYWFAAAMFTLKFVLTYRMTHETAQGVLRMREARVQPIGALLRAYVGGARELLQSPQTLAVAGVGNLDTLISIIKEWGFLVEQVGM